MRYVALGDSYTIGTSVDDDERWPNQLTARVPELELELVANLAVDGFTSADLIADELPRLAALRPELVTLLIGVNDVVRGVADSQYERNVTLIVDELLGRLPPDRIVGIATPDYTVTPMGAAYGDPVQHSDGIVRVNAILRETCAARGVRFVPEVFEISQAARDEPELTASDGLHPSGAQYARWVDAIVPAIMELIGARSARHRGARRLP